MAGRKSLPHEPPLWLDPSCEIWFLTICCERGSGPLLTSPGIARELLDSVALRWKRGQWHPHIFVLMPDHCHGLFSFPQDARMKNIVTAWKRWAAVHNGVCWQRGFFDHRLRHDESFEQKAHYIAENPVRAGLTDRANAWPHIFRAPGIFTGIKRS